MTVPSTVLRRKRRRALARQCASCHRLWAVRLVRDEQQPVARCCYCGSPRAVGLSPQTSSSQTSSSQTSSSQTSSPRTEPSRSA